MIEDGRLRVIAWRVTALGESRVLDFHWALAPVTEDTVRRRAIYLPSDRRLVEVPVHDRYALAPGTVLQGPLVLEERESTTVVPRRAEVSILADRTLSIILA